MRRRQPQTGGALVLPVELRDPPVVECWCSAQEIGRHSFAAVCAACGRKGPRRADCRAVLEGVAQRRWEAARRGWLAEQGLAARGRPTERPRWEAGHRAAS